MNKQHIAGSRVSTAAFRRRSALMLSAGAASLLLACPALAQTPPAPGTLPTGESLVGSSAATFDRSVANTLTVTQTSSRALIDWTSFDIASNAWVHFNQNSRDDIALNRVTGGDPTQIYGQLSAYGNIGILNPNGVYFDGSAIVDVGGLIATTGNLADQAEYLAGGPIRFEGATGGFVEVGVSGSGSISIDWFGLAAFVAPHVVNNGVITANAGLVELAAGDTFTLDLGGDGLIALGVSSTSPLVENYGDIFAFQGTIRMSAQVAAAVVSDVINAGGVLQADDVFSDNGVIVLAANGGVNVIGDLRGGDVTATGRRIHGVGGVDTGGTLTLNVNADGADTTGETLIADALGVIGTVGGGTTLNLGDGTYAAGATINKTNVTVDGGGVAVINVVNGQNGLSVNADDVTISNLEIVGPIVDDWRDTDWNDPAFSYSIGVNVGGNRTDVSIVDNYIHDIRTGVNYNVGANGIVTGNIIENTKGGILSRPADLTDISGNSQGPLGNEWGIVLGLGNIDDGAVAGEARQAELLAYSNNNHGMSVFDRGYGFNNRTHIFVDDDTPVATAADDFGYGNGLGNERQPLPSIQAAVNSVVTGGWINVGAGTYDGFGTSFGGPANVSILGAPGAIIDGTVLPGTGRIVDLRADGTIFSGFTISGAGTGVGVSVSGRGVTVSNNAISNVLTGVQTTTQYAAGNATITGNSITAGYGVSLQNTGNTVSDNEVTASTEGVGLLVSNNLIVNNAFNIGAGGDALNFYGGATATGLTTAYNIVSIQGGGLQNAVYLAGARGTVNVGDGTYNENILINAPDMTLRSVNQHGAVIDAGGAGSGISISSVNGSLGDITIDGFTVQNWNVGGITQGMAAAPFATVHVLNNNIIGPVGGSTNHGNGIQVSGDGSTVIGNTVSGAILNSADWSGSGILVVNGSNILVEGNQVSGSDLGIAVANWNNVGGMSGITVRNNMISHSAEGISVQAFAGQQWTPSGPISSVEITGNTITDSESGLGVWDYTPSLDAIWASTVTDISGNTFERNQSHVSSNFADADVLSLFGVNTFDRTIHATGGSAIYGDLSFAVADAAAGSDLVMSDDLFVEDDQVVIDRDLTLTGVAGTEIHAGANFTGGPSQAWWLVEEGVTFGLSNVALDGNGHNIHFALRNHGDTTIDSVDFRDIRNGAYFGIAVASFGGNVAGGGGAGSWADSSLTVWDSTFENIGRIGVLVKGTGATADIAGNTYTGKGDGDHLDYGFEVGAGGFATIIGNTITDNRGVASTDGSTSAGVLVTSYYGGASTAVIENNVISDNTTGVAVGYDGSDVSVVEAIDNDLSGNAFGATLTSASAVADFSGNWWGVTDEADVAAYMGGAQAGAVDFSTYLTLGGFQFGSGFLGDFSELAVTSLGGQTAGGRIQEALDLVCACGVVNVNDGVYVETVNIHDSVTLAGQSQAGTIINGGVRINSHTAPGLQIDGVTISDLTINPGAGQVGLIALSNSADGQFNTLNLSVSDVTINGNAQHAVGLFDVDGAAFDNVTVNGAAGFAGVEAIGLNGFTMTGGAINGAGTGFNLWNVAGYEANGPVALSGVSFSGNQTHLSLEGMAGDVPGLLAGNAFDRTIHATGGERIYGDLAFAVADAAAGSELNLSADTFTLASTLNVNKALTLRGQSQAGTLIDATAVNGYGMLVNADDVTLSHFTFQGDNTSTSSAEYGVKVQPDTGVASDRLLNFAINDVTIQGFGGSELDLNGVVGATVQNVTLDGQGTKGVGLAITDSADVTVSNITTLNNLWGAIALYQKNAFYNQQLDNITIDAAGSVYGEDLGVFVQMESAMYSEPGQLNLNGFNYVVRNPGHRAEGDQFTFFRTDFANATALALGLAAPETSSIEGWNGTDVTNVFDVVDGLTIGAAVRDARAGGTINVAAGTYSGFGTQFGGPAGLNILGNGAVIDATGTPATPILRIVDLRADGTTFSGFTINGDGNHVGVSVSGRGVTVSNNTINNVLTGVQTTTEYVDGNGFITGNTIVAGYGISVQNGGNTVTGNTVTAENMGFGLRRKTGVGPAAVNTVSGNTFTVGAGGEALSLVEDATVADDLIASNNTVSIAGGGLQGAFDLAGNNGDLTVGAATYAENVASNNANMTLAFNGATVDSLALTGAGTQISGNLTGVGNLSFADLTLLGALTLASQTGNVTTGAVGGAHALSATANAGAVTFGALNVASLTASGANIVTAGAVTNGAQSYTGATTLNGAYTTGGGDFTVAGASTLAGATNVATGGGNATLGSVTGPFAFTAAAGAGDVTLGAVNTASLTASGGSVVTAGATTTGAQSYTGATTLNGVYTTGGGDFTVAGASTLAGATNVATGGGDATFGAVNGAAPGAQAFTANAGAGSVSLGSVGATARLGAVQVVSANTVLNGDIYAGNSLGFGGGVVQLTAALTTFDSRVSPATGGDITFASDIVGTANGAQNVAFIAGSGASLASDGDITLANAGTDAVRLGAMTATGGDFSAQTVKLAGDFTSTLSGDQVFSANTLDTLGGVNSQVGGNASGPIIAGQGVIITAGGDITSSPITAGGPVVLTAGGQIVSTITTPGSITLTAQQGLDVQLTGGAVFVSAPNGVVNGVFTTISTDGNGSYVINGQRQVGDPTDPRQILIDAFITPAGGVVGPTGVIELPAGLALGLIAPAGEGEGQRPAILVNDVARLGELLRLGYTAIIIQIDESGLIIEEELLLAEAAE